MGARPRLHHVVLLALLGGVVFWVTQRAQHLRQDPAAVLEALRAAEGPSLPQPQQVGALRREAVETFDPQTLYDFINGAADAYLARGFSRCVTTTYEFAGEGGKSLELTAEVYRFTTPAGARAQLEAERPPEARAVPGAPEAWWSDGLLLATEGHDYLKLTAFEQGKAVEEALLRLLVAWQGGGHGESPL